VGEIHPDVLDALGVAEQVAWLGSTCRSARSGSPRSRRRRSAASSTDLDLAFAVPDTQPPERIDKAIRQGAGALLVDLLFDVFRAGWPMARGLAFRLIAGAGPDAHGRRHRRRATRSSPCAKLGATLATKPPRGAVGLRLGAVHER
jgi:hypothetical protein